MCDRVFSGPAIRRIRDAAGLSRAELSQMALVSVTTIKTVEAPGARRPKAITLTALAQALGCTVDEFTVPAHPMACDTDAA
jgi:transcriptional regulator with XRE-family HTH domain